MAKLQRDTIKVNTLQLTETTEGVFSVTTLNVTGVEEESNAPVTYSASDLTEEQKQILGEQIAQQIKDYIRFIHMTQ